MGRSKQSCKRITINLPSHLLEQAQQATQKNMTETIIAGLQTLKRARAYKKALDLKGKLDLKIDLETSRERHY